MVTVEVYYGSGDSFSTWEETLEIAFFETKEEADDFVYYLKQHNQFHEEMERLTYGEKAALNRKNVLKKYSECLWFVEEDPQGIFIYKDKQYYTPYTGYFEHLISVTVKTEN